jgi:hypothetical protein
MRRRQGRAQDIQIVQVAFQRMRALYALRARRGGGGTSEGRSSDE